MGILGLLMIFGARILDVSCNTIRILFLVKGQRFVAACIGFVEVMIYMMVLGFILGGGKRLTVWELLFYCGGFATGNYVGSWLEEKLMNTFILIEVILEDGPSAQAAIEAVRGRGLGRNGPRLIVEIFCRRHDVQAVQALFAHDGFVTVSDVKRCTGGWFPKRL